MITNTCLLPAGMFTMRPSCVFVCVCVGMGGVETNSTRTGSYAWRKTREEPTVRQCYTLSNTWAIRNVVVNSVKLQVKYTKLLHILHVFLHNERDGPVCSCGHVLHTPKKSNDIVACHRFISTLPCVSSYKAPPRTPAPLAAPEQRDPAVPWRSW